MSLTTTYKDFTYNLFTEKNNILAKTDYYKDSPYTAEILLAKSKIIEVPEYFEYKDKIYYIGKINNNIFENFNLSKNDQPEIIIDKNNKLIFSEDHCIYSALVDPNNFEQVSETDFYLTWCYNRTLKSIKINPKCQIISGKAFEDKYNNIIEEIFNYNNKYFLLNKHILKTLPNLKQIIYKNKIIKKINNSWKII